MRLIVGATVLAALGTTAGLLAYDPPRVISARNKSELVQNRQYPVVDALATPTVASADGMATIRGDGALPAVVLALAAAAIWIVMKQLHKRLTQKSANAAIMAMGVLGILFILVLFLAGLSTVSAIAGPSVSLQASAAGVKAEVRVWNRFAEDVTISHAFQPEVVVHYGSPKVHNCIYLVWNDSHGARGILLISGVREDEGAKNLADAIRSNLKLSSYAEAVLTTRTSM